MFLHKKQDFQSSQRRISRQEKGRCLLHRDRYVQECREAADRWRSRQQGPLCRIMQVRICRDPDKYL